MASQDEKKPPLVVNAELSATELVVDGLDVLVIRLNAETPAARLLLGGMDVMSRCKAQVLDVTRTPERDPTTGGYPTTSVTLMFRS